MNVTVKELLCSAARDRWGDEWFLETIEDADGDQQHRIHHTVEQVADGVVIRDVMKRIGDGVLVDRLLIDTAETIAVIETPINEVDRSDGYLELGSEQ